MNKRISFWAMYSNEEKKAYEAGRKAAYTSIGSLTYGKGFRNSLIETAYRRGFEHEQGAKSSEISFNADEWNKALEKMVPHLRELEEIGRVIPGHHGAILRKKAQRLASGISDSLIDF